MLFIGPKDEHDQLRDVAMQVFALLHIDDKEERFSSNYSPDEHYYSGYAEDVVLKIYDADDNRTPEYPFRLSFQKPTWRKGPTAIDSDPGRIATMLARAGLKVFVPTGSWFNNKWDGKGKKY